MNQSIKILIAEDDKELGPMMQEDLQTEGFSTVELVENGQEAFNKTVQSSNKGEDFDIIISDWDMPVMNGIQLLEKVRKNTKTQDVPFILVSGVSKADIVKMASRHGCSSILLKPFEKETLIKKIKLLTEGVSLKSSSGAS